jgi:hypothetical protein
VASKRSTELEYYERTACHPIGGHAESKEPLVNWMREHRDFGQPTTDELWRCNGFFLIFILALVLKMDP